MISHRLIVARIFQVGSFVIGIPSLLFGMFMTWTAIQTQSKPQPESAPSGNQAIDLAISGVEWIGKGLSALGDIAHWVSILLAVLAFALVIYAVVLFFIARGIRHNRVAARVLGILLALPPLLSSLTTIASIREPVPLLISSLTVGVAGYVVWALGWKFTDPPPLPYS